MNVKEDSVKDNAVVLRQRLRQARAGIAEPQRRREALLMRGRLFTWLAIAREQAPQQGRPAPASVAAFWPMQDEPDLRPLLRQWAEAGLQVLLPVVKTAGAPLEFHPWTPDTPMQPGAYGIPAPAGGQPALPDVVLVPTLGYTAQADRLGYGGGYYDRTLAALRERGHPHTTIGIAWREGRIDDPHYRPAPHDVRLDAVLTPTGWVPKAP
ncbi:5-formyltetrahydrofolate cyclo-ligase [Orrella sp. JC864]|uniref:5-formyltetrahydrofolate cyclo-ligase n=1 Tax=Orrella sp. JC864 TaxID=3120298 RepID=UPI0012BC2CB4